MILFNILMLSASALASTAIDSFKDQYCTDPRTMRKHAAYTEWADAYSCTRHRCQPGGRNLAIYTVGCKRVEAPESAIECEEVVEDTNMQFPFCCTRLRCLVVVRGEVWTRVLGQPWETLPAAPWSHMYKMKKPPPADGSFLPKRPANDGKRTDPSVNAKIWDDTAGHPNDPGAVKIGEGPIYELTSDGEDASHNKVLRSSKKPAPTEAPDCNEVVPRAAAPSPDIVIALSTNEGKERKKNDGGQNSGHKRKKSKSASMFPEEIEAHNEPDLAEGDESIGATEKLPPFGSEEQIYANSFGVTQKVPFKAQTIAQPAWTEEPQSPGNEPSIENRDPALTDFGAQEPEKKEKPSNLQALVDAIGTRMRDIESVVQRMSEKVHQSKPGEPEGGSAEKNPQRPHSDGESTGVDHKEDKDQARKGKRPAHDEHYKRFSVKNHGSKYLHATESTTDLPLYIEDTNMNGYFSDASNTVLRRASQSKEPAATYMAPVETRRKSHINPEGSGEEESKKHKKHTHKKKRSKGRGHKKHRGKDDKRKKFNKISSVELDKNAVSLDDSSVM